MIRRTCVLALVIGLLGMNASGAQYPVVDAIAKKIAQKYQQATCEQLWLQKAQKTPPTQQEQEAVQMLRADPKMRAEFVTIVGPPIVGKMIECGMIP